MPGHCLCLRHVCGSYQLRWRGIDVRNPELKNGISDLEKAKEKALKQLADR